MRPWGARIPWGFILLPSVVGTLILILYGGAAVIVGGLVLSDVMTPSGRVDEHALRWHVFHLGSLVLGLGSGSRDAAWRFAREGRSSSV